MFTVFIRRALFNAVTVRGLLLDVLEKPRAAMTSEEHCQFMCRKADLGLCDILFFEPLIMRQSLAARTMGTRRGSWQHRQRSPSALLDSPSLMSCL